jgi:hypothetical protein
MRHGLTASILMAGTLTLAAACDSGREPIAPAALPAPSFSATSQQYLDDQIEALIRQLFPPPGLRVAATVRFEAIEFQVRRGKTANARKMAFNLVAFALQKYSNHQLIGDQSETTRNKLQSFVDLLFQFVGLGSAPIPVAALGPDGAVAIVGPAGGQVVTESQLAGAEFPAGALPQNVIVTINRAPNQADPLPTVLQQFLLFYEFKTFPEVPQFGQLVTVGVCVLDGPINEAEVDPANLRLAHQLHSDPTAIEILPRVAQGLVSPTLCADAFGAREGLMNDLAGAGKTVAQDLFWLAMGAPKDLSATGSRRRLMPGGLGGRTGSFSTFGAVNFTGEFVPYQELGYRYLIGESPPAGFQQPNFDASAWFSGQGAFGGGSVSGTCPSLVSTIHTSWPAAGEEDATEILLRKRFSGSAQDVQILVPVDNDVQVFVNGVDITSTGGTVGEDGFLPHENCADPAYPFVFSVQNSSLLAGGNLVVVRARDRGGVSYVDVKVTGQLPEE